MTTENIDWLKIRAVIRRHCRAAAGHDMPRLKRITAARIEESDIDDITQECTAEAWLRIESGVSPALAIWYAVRSIGRISHELSEGQQCDPAPRWMESDYASGQFYVEKYGKYDVVLVDSWDHERQTYGTLDCGLFDC